MRNDLERREALRELQILDTPREAQFNEAVELVNIICKTSGALITLIDHERQWFKASFGFDISETPVEHSICVNCLDSDEVFEIRDLTQDDRTRYNPIVTGKPYLRFYAGAAIRNAKGISIGALCVTDSQPRAAGLSVDQTDFLLSKAKEVSGLLILRFMTKDHIALENNAA